MRIATQRRSSSGTASQFLWLSERDGFMHLYLYAQDGTLAKQLTQGDWMIDSSAYNLLTPGRPVHVDPTGTLGVLHHHAAAARWSARSTASTSATGELQQVSQQAGFHLSALSGDGRYLVDQFSDVDTPPITQIVKTDGSGAASAGRGCRASPGPAQLTREFVTVKAHDGVDLYAQIVKPENFDPTRKISGRHPLVRRPRPADGVEPLRHDQHLQPHRARRALHAGRIPRLAAGQPGQLRSRARLRDADLRRAGPGRAR